MIKELKEQFQTPPAVCKYMANLMPVYDFQNNFITKILEPTPGAGNIVKAIDEELSPLSNIAYELFAPKDFFKLKRKKFDCILLNPPFSEKHAFGIPPDLDLRGMRMGYYILKRCMEMSDNVIALMPWFTLLDSDVRTRELKEYGLVSLTSLPRKTFGYSRIQTVVLHLKKGYKGETLFKTFNY